MDKILIIEDDVEINTLLTDFLKENGYVVYSQYDGLHVLDFLHKEKIDLIILDIMLPYRSGDIILADIRRQFTIPVLIIFNSILYNSRIILRLLSCTLAPTLPSRARHKSPHCKQAAKRFSNCTLRRLLSILASTSSISKGFVM